MATKKNNKAHKMRGRRKKNKKPKNSTYEIVNNKLKNLLDLNNDLDEKINLIKENGVNQDIYFETFKIIDKIKYSIDSFYLYKMSRSQSNKYYRYSSYFRGRYTHFKRLTYKFYIKEIKHGK